MTYIGTPFPWDEQKKPFGGLDFTGQFLSMPSKPFKFGFVLGRFQHIHIGHEHIINKALNVCEKVLILVGSSQDDARVTNPIRNPYETHFRITLINKIYGDNPNVIVASIPDLTHELDISYDWGRYVLENVVLRSNQYGITDNPDLFIGGNDEERIGWFDPEDIKNLSQLVVSRGKIDISATKMRNLIVENNFWRWREYANQKLHPLFGEIRERLLEVEYYKQLSEENEKNKGN